MRVALRNSPRKFTVGLPGTSRGRLGGPVFLKLFCSAPASISPASTMKCSFDSRWGRSTRSKKARTQRSELRRQLLQRRVDYLPDRPQRMVPEYLSFGRDVGPHRRLFTVVARMRASSISVTRIVLEPSRRPGVQSRVFPQPAREK